MHPSHSARPVAPRALVLLLAAAAPLGLAACRDKPVTEVAPAKPAAAAQTLPQMMESLQKKPDPALRARVLERVQALPSGEKIQLDGTRVVVVGLTPDFWTTD